MPVIRKETITIERKYENDVLISETYLVNDRAHRTDGPAITYYDSKTGKVILEEWYFEDKLHREGGPAIIDYNRDGSVYHVQWWINAKQHREDGPATYYCLNDDIMQPDHDGYVEYWKHDREITEAIIASGCKPGTDEFKFTWELV